MQIDLIFGALGMITILMFVVGLIINALLLGVVLGWTKGENREFGTTVITALIMAIVGIIPVIGCIIQWYVIKTRHEQTWGGAIATWIVLLIVTAVIIVAIVFLFLGGLVFLMPTPYP